MMNNYNKPFPLACRYLFFYLLVLLVNEATWATTTTSETSITAAINFNVVTNRLIPAFAQEIIPILEKYVNEEIEIFREPQTIIKGPWFNNNASVVANIFDFNVQPITSDKTQITPVYISDKAVRINVTATDIKFDAGVRLDIDETKNGQIVNGCDFGGRAEVGIGQFDYSVEIAIETDESNTQKMTLKGVDSDLMDFTFKLIPMWKIDICSAIAKGLLLLLKTNFNEISESITDSIKNSTNITSSIVEIINNNEDIITSQDLPLFQWDPFTLGEGNIIADVSIETFQTSGNGILETNLAATITSILNNPPYRNGFQLETSTINDGIIPAASLDGRLAGVHISFNLINQFIKNAWYLTWAGINNQNGKVESRLCDDQPKSETDSCPFPPYIAGSSFLDAFLLRLIFLLRFTVFNSFRYQLVAPPPTLDFVDNVLTGTVQGNILLQGNKLFGGLSDIAQVRGTVIAQTTLPTYNEQTRVLQEFEILNIEITELRADFIGSAPLFGFGVNFILGTVSKAFNYLSDLFLDPANQKVEEVLKEVTIEPKVMTSFADAIIYLRGVSVNAVSSGPGNPGFVDLDTASIGVDVETTDLFRLQRSSSDNVKGDSFYQTDAYTRAYNRAFDAQDPDMTYTSTCSVPDDSDQLYSYTFRWSDEKNIVEIFNKDNETWEVAPNPTSGDR